MVARSATSRPAAVRWSCSSTAWPGSSENWREVIEPLSRNHTVIAPDLPGHGTSEPGSGDYCLGAHAAGLRDLLVSLGHERATDRRPLPRRRHRDAVHLPVPGAGRAPRPGLERRPRARGEPGPAGGGAARRGPLHRRHRRSRRRASARSRPWFRADRAAAQRRPRRGGPRYASLADRRAASRFPRHPARRRRHRRPEGSRGDRLYLAEALPILIVWGGGGTRSSPSPTPKPAQVTIPGARLSLR